MKIPSIELNLDNPRGLISPSVWYLPRVPDSSVYSLSHVPVCPTVRFFSLRLFLTFLVSALGRVLAFLTRSFAPLLLPSLYVVKFGAVPTNPACGKPTFVILLQLLAGNSQESRPSYDGACIPVFWLKRYGKLEISPSNLSK
jgi:hypothetical protein